MKVELKINNRPFKDSTLYENLKLIGAFLIILSMALFEVLGIVFIQETFESNTIFLYVPFIIIKGVYIPYLIFDK